MSTDTFTCCETPVPWPTAQQDEECPECGLTWEREPVTMGAGARIKGARAQTGTRVSSGPGVVPSLVAVAIHLIEDAFFLRCNGERPPGAPPYLRAETWADWDGRAEDFLRREVF